MNMKMKLIAAALPMALLLGVALAPNAMAADGIGVGTGTTGPVGFENWQGWYEYNTYTWHGNNLGQGWIEIVPHRAYVSGGTQTDCNLALTDAMASVKPTAWNACYRL